MVDESKRLRLILVSLPGFMSGRSISQFLEKIRRHKYS